MLAERWGGRFDAPESMITCMASLELPRSLGESAEDAARLRSALLYEDRIEVAVHAFRGRVWMRVAAQAYNDEADFARLADAVARRL